MNTALATSKHKYAYLDQNNSFCHYSSTACNVFLKSPSLSITKMNDQTSPLIILANVFQCQQCVLLLGM